MKKIVRITIALVVLTASVISGNVRTLHAEESAVTAVEDTTFDSEDPAWTSIYTVEDFKDISQNPEGNYILMNHLDFKNIPWTPISFSGSLDGNGYALLNVNITDCSDTVKDTYDGNMKIYETTFAGLFDTLTDAKISNLELLGINVEVASDSPCFIGSLAGYMENSTISNCKVTGSLSLKAHDRMFGVGGIIGYGNGLIEYSSADVTLVCVDTDATTRDEQFLGGICSTGFPDINYCTVNISGFISEHGYVHSGGLMGMYMFSPSGTTYWGSIIHNDINGKITFFEDNTKRRAYCKFLIGEICNWDFTNGWNQDHFIRDEIKTYDKDLYPHDCDNPDFEDVLTASSCNEIGFTTRTCKTCGYSYLCDYTLPAHSYEYTTTEPTYEAVGTRTGVCSLCGDTVTEEIPMLEPTPAPEPEEAASPDTAVITSPDSADKEKEDAPSAETAPSESDFVLYFGLAGFIALLVLISFLVYRLFGLKASKKHQ